MKSLLKKKKKTLKLLKLKFKIYSIKRNATQPTNLLNDALDLVSRKVCFLLSLFCTHARVAKLFVLSV